MIYRLWSNLQSGGAVPFAGVRLGSPVRNTGAPGSRAPNRILPFQANPTFRAASLNAFSVWQQITAGELTDRVLVNAIISWTPTSPGTTYFQIGTGAAGLEVPIFEGSIANNESGAGSTPFTTATWPIPFIKVPANTRIAYRTYFKGAVGASVPFVGLYLDTLDTIQASQDWNTWVDTYVTGLEITSVYHQPAIATPIVIAGGAAYTTVIANLAQKTLVMGVVQDENADSTSTHGQLAIATGAVNSETDHAYIPCPGSLLNFRWFGDAFPARPILCNAGERLAARWDYSSSGGNVSLNFWLANAN